MSSSPTTRSLSPRARRSWETFDCKRVAAGSRWPEVLEQDVHAHAGASIEREPDQQLGGLACRHREPITIPASLDCAENGDSEHLRGYDNAARARGPRRRQRSVSAPSAPGSTVHLCPTPTPPSSAA